MSNRRTVAGSSAKNTGGSRLKGIKTSLVDETEQSSDENTTMNKAGVDLSKIPISDLEELKDTHIFQSISRDYDVNDVINEWFGRFDELEKSDVWYSLSAAEKAQVFQYEADLKEGKPTQDPGCFMRAFDDCTDPSNIGFIQQQMKQLSKDRPMLSEKSFSSGESDYSDREKNEDDDQVRKDELSTLKVLTREAAAKKQVQLDLNRIRHKEVFGEEEDENAEKVVSNDKEGELDDLQEETLAQYAAIEDGQVDLYKRALQISKRQAKKVVAKRQGQREDFDVKEDVLDDLTDDEELQREIRDLATGKLQLSTEPREKMMKFDPDDSYFSEDSSDAEKDDVKAWQKEAHDLRKNKASFMASSDFKLANKGYETRETRKASRRLDLDRPIPNKLKGAHRAYNPKDALYAQIKVAGAQKHELQIKVVANEMSMIQKEAEKPINRVNSGDHGGVQSQEADQKPFDQKRLFIRNFDDGKLYTNRYVRKLKAANKKLLDKFTLGSKYALTAQKKQVMARARRLVVDSHDKLLATFQTEALSLLVQNRVQAEQLGVRNEQVEKLIKSNRQLELDMSQLLLQSDYTEERLPEVMKEFPNYQKQQLSPMKAFKNEQKLEKEADQACILPEKPTQGYKFKWEKLTTEERVERADRRSHISCNLQEMEPNFTNDVFDFYGVYTRISEPQKFRYAESRVINYYKDVCQEVMYSNAVLNSQIENMLDINRTNQKNERQIKIKVQKEKHKKNRLKQELIDQRKGFEVKIKQILDARAESQLDLTAFYHQKIEYLETELNTSAKIREMLEQNNDALKAEIVTLAKIVKTSRLHFRELEKCDFEALEKQIQKYEIKVSKLKVSESAIQGIRASRAKRRLNDRQAKTDREEINAQASKHNYSHKLNVPIDEKTPKHQLRELIELNRPSKIYERLPKTTQGTSLEDVMAEKRSQAMKFFDDSMFRVSKLDTKVELNEDSLTEHSLGRELNPDVFQTVICEPSQTNRSGSQESKSKGTTSARKQRMSSRNPITKVSTVSASGFVPFLASQHDIESEKGMLLEAAMEDLNEYLIDQLSSENQDLIHDQILISQQENQDQQTKAEYETVKVTSFNSDIDLTDKSTNTKKSTRAKPLTTRPQNKPAPATSKVDSGSNRQEQYLEHFITVKVQNRNPTPAGRMTATAADSSKDGMTDLEVSSIFMPKNNLPSQNSPRMRNMILDAEDVKGDQSARLQTANQLLGMPRRDPLKQKSNNHVPSMTAAFGGEKARQAVIKAQMQHTVGGPASRLPQISDSRFSREDKKRATSIQPRNAATASNTLHSGSNNIVLQSLVNNNAFLGRGKFQSTQRGATLPASPQNAQPVSPPSIQVQGTSSNIQQMIYNKRGNKVQVRLPGSTKRQVGLNQEILNSETNNSVYGFPPFQLNASKPRLQKQGDNDGSSLVFDEKAYSMMKLNLPSSADRDGQEPAPPQERQLRPGSGSMESKQREMQMRRQSDAQLSSEPSQARLSPEPRLVLDQTPSVKEENTSYEGHIGSSAMGSNLASCLSPEAKNRGQTPDDTASSLRMTKMATIEIQSDPFRNDNPKDNSDLGSPRKLTGASAHRKKANAVKKKPAKIVSEAKKMEQSMKEQKQKQLQAQLKNAK